MRIDLEENQGVLIFRVAGDITFENWYEVAKKLEEEREKGHRSIILNWENVIILDTSGLQTLVALIKTAKKDPSFNFSLVTNNPDHIDLISLVGFNKMIKVFSTEEEAIEDIRANQPGQE